MSGPWPKLGLPIVVEATKAGLCLRPVREHHETGGRKIPPRSFEEMDVGDVMRVPTLDGERYVTRTPGGIAVERVPKGANGKPVIDADLGPDRSYAHTALEDQIGHRCAKPCCENVQHAPGCAVHGTPREACDCAMRS